MKGFLDYAKANPGKLTYSSAGIGTLPHVTTELLLRTAGLQVTHVPYKGAAPAFTDLLAGVVQLKYDTYATSAPMARAGKLKVLATAEERFGFTTERTSFDLGTGRYARTGEVLPYDELAALRQVEHIVRLTDRQRSDGHVLCRCGLWFGSGRSRRFARAD